VDVKHVSDWTVKDYVETIRLSVSFTRRYYLSIFLSILGVSVFTVLLFLILLFIGSLPLSVAYGPFDEIFDVFDSIGLAIDRATDVEAVGIVLFVGSALLAPFLIALGALFGMGQEMMESGTVSAEEVLLWYRQKFTSLAAGGIAQFLCIMGPIGLEYILAASYYGDRMPDGTVLTILVAIAVCWFLFSSGALSMVFPSIVDGMTVASSIKHALGLARKNLKAVFSIWITFSSLALIMLGPIIAQEFADIEILVGVWYDFYVLVSVIALAMILLPLYVLSATRTYLIISDPNVRDVQ
jgi:hypothetical protein